MTIDSAPERSLASFYRALFCPPQAKLKGSRLATMSVGLSSIEDCLCYRYEYSKVWATLVCEHGGIKFTHLCARWESNDLPQCEHSWMCVWTHVRVLLDLFVCVCSYEGRMAMLPIVRPGSATAGISLRNRKGVEGSPHQGKGQRSLASLGSLWTSTQSAFVRCPTVNRHRDCLCPWNGGG